MLGKLQRRPEGLTLKLRYSLFLFTFHCTKFHVPEIIFMGLILAVLNLSVLNLMHANTDRRAFIPFSSFLRKMSQNNNTRTNLLYYTLV